MSRTEDSPAWTSSAQDESMKSYIHRRDGPQPIIPSPNYKERSNNSTPKSSPLDSSRHTPKTYSPFKAVQTTLISSTRTPNKSTPLALEEEIASLPTLDEYRDLITPSPPKKPLLPPSDGSFTFSYKTFRKPNNYFEGGIKDSSVGNLETWDTNDDSQTPPERGNKLYETENPRKNIPEFYSISSNPVSSPSVLLEVDEVLGCETPALELIYVEPSR
eukprot:TRINITY_DN587_c0_g2_i1.p1 TRINITY_DN587_c0_g2~~TRINITY_DN587_c0_g2_i1.p1  ORF type:complete len:217 (+),score=29.34 TRINITY_DN587_c0_g2_i1:96-746(+)